MIKNITNLGDSAIYCDFGKEVNKQINSNVIKYFKNIKEKKIYGVNNLTPSYNKLIISFDLSKINFKEIRDIILNLKIKDYKSDKGKTINIPICVDDDFSLDLKRLTARLNINFDSILEIFFKKEYFCYMTGFIAGMPFLGDIDQKIRLKRLETPRVKVPKGSIGITEQFCNIYTYESPGGWNIIGNTPVKIFDKFNQKNPTKINPGDQIKFFQIKKSEYYNWSNE